MNKCPKSHRIKTGTTVQQGEERKSLPEKPNQEEQSDCSQTLWKEDHQDVTATRKHVKHYQKVVHTFVQIPG